MKGFRSFVAALLAVILLAGMLPVSGAATAEPEGEYMSMEEAAVYVRQKLKDFQTNFDFKFRMEDPNYYTDGNLMWIFMDEVFEHTGVPDEGDYMRWSFQQYGFDLQDEFDGKTHYITVNGFMPKYNNGVLQEELVDRKVEEILASLDLDGKSDYEKIKAIYTWICENVEYSEEVLSGNFDLCNPPDDMKVYWSAYGALCLGSATCQGFSMAVYRLMLEAGIDCRLIAGDVGSGIGHGWNIVELDGVYYYLEPTEDSGNVHGGDGLKNFLKGSASFRIDDVGSERMAWVESYTAEFVEQYPVSVLDYGQEELLTGDAGQVLGSGRCGNSANWTLTADGTLTISGSGPTWVADLFGFWNGGQMIPRWDNLNGYIKQVEIREGITAIGSYAFANCPRLTQVAIPSSVSSIGRFAFGLCESLTRITLPDTVESLGEKVFYQCIGLESVSLSAGLEEIPEQTFCGCTGLETVYIPEGVRTIGNVSFAYCTSLQGLEIPSSVTAIKDLAFAHAFDPAAEVTVVIPKTVTELGGACFEASAVYRLELKMPLDTLEPMMFNQCNGLQFVELPDTVQSIGTYAFADCANLKGIRLPPALRELGDCAFMHCYGLQSIELPNTLTSIPTSAFIRCRSLEEVVIPASVESIGNGAFEDCTSLKKVTILGGVRKIYDFAFGFCDVLDTVVFKGDAPEIVGSSLFASALDLTLYYPRDNGTWTKEIMKELVTGGTEYIGDGWMEVYSNHDIDAPHTMDEQWRMDGDIHWKQCSGCNYREQEEGHRLNQVHTCEDCGFFDPNAHVPQWESNALYHISFCVECGDTVSSGDHIYNNENICEICGYNPETDHDFRLEMDARYHWKQCAKCGEIQGKERHSFDSEGLCQFRGCGVFSQGFDWLPVLLVVLVAGSAVIIVLLIKKKRAKKNASQERGITNETI